MKRIAICGLVSLLAIPLFAAGQSGSQPVKGMASTVGLYVYPKNQQSSTQQLTDESQCYTNAKTQSGFDPNATAPAPSTKAKDQKSSSDKPMAKGAARGAAISGVTGGDPAAGARRGAIIGGIKSRRQQKQETGQAEKQAQATKTQSQQKLDDFKRSMSACLDARDYSVK